MRGCHHLSYYFCIRCHLKRGCPFITPKRGLTRYKLAEWNHWHNEPLVDPNAEYYTEEQVLEYLNNDEVSQD